jgi:hypothetical protein
VFSINDRIRIHRHNWFEHVDRTKKDECRSRLFSTSPKEQEILVDHAEGGVPWTGTGQWPNPWIGEEEEDLSDTQYCKTKLLLILSSTDYWTNKTRYRMAQTLRSISGERDTRLQALLKENFLVQVAAKFNLKSEHHHELLSSRTDAVLCAFTLMRPES